MAINQVYRFHSMRINKGTNPLIGGMTQTSVSNNPEIQQEFVDANPYPTVTHIRSFAQDTSFTTTNVAAALDAVGFGVTCLEANETVELFYANITACEAGPATGSVHRRITIGSPDKVGAMLVFRSLNCEHRGDALYSFGVVPIFDGTNAPISISNNVALPALTADTKKRFTLGPQTVSGHNIEQRKTVNIDGGVSLDRDSADSSIFDEFITLQQAAQKMTVNGLFGDWFDVAKLGLGGNRAEHADSKLILRRRSVDDDGGYFPQGDSEHVSVTISGTAVATDVASTSDTQKATSAFEIYADHDGVNVPLIGLTGQTY